MSRRGRLEGGSRGSPRLRGKSQGANPWPARFKLGGVLAALVLVNLYIFVWRKETSLGSLMRSASVGQPVDPLRPGQPVTRTPTVNPETAQIAEESGGDELARTQPAIPDTGQVAPEDSRAADAPAARTLEGQLGKRDTLSAALGRAGLAGGGKEELLRALRKVLDVRRVREGQRFTLQVTSSNELVEFTYEASAIETYRVVRGQGGELVGRRERQKLRREIVKLGGSVTSSLYESIARTGEKTTLVAFFVDVFAWDVNFFTDTRPGDGFKMVVEKLYNGDSFYRYGRVLAAEYTARSKGKSYRAFWFQPPCAATGDGGDQDGEGERRNRCPEGGYYDEKARSIQKSQLKTPLKYVRITSKFTSNRFHPILHTVKSHLGVDYAAPTGTPVWATSSGRIVSRSYAGGAGNMVVLSHAGGAVSIYMHLSKFAGGQKVGDRVRQKQVIGYVGSTGLSTGPHLHFAMKVKGKYVNPLANQKVSSSGPPLSSAYRARFQADLAPRLAALESISTEENRAQVADAAPGEPAGAASPGAAAPGRPGTAAQ